MSTGYADLGTHGALDPDPRFGVQTCIITRRPGIRRDRGQRRSRHAELGIPDDPPPIQDPEEPVSTPEDASRGGRIRTYDFLLPKLDLALLVEVLACPECDPKVMEVIRMHLNAHPGRHTEHAYRPCAAVAGGSRLSEEGDQMSQTAEEPRRLT
ncbi:MAG: hypothetical protein AAF211_34395, partial [Myxococcota bacterium]